MLLTNIGKSMKQVRTKFLATCGKWNGHFGSGSHPFKDLKHPFPT